MSKIQRAIVRRRKKNNKERENAYHNNNKTTTLQSAGASAVSSSRNSLFGFVTFGPNLSGWKSKLQEAMLSLIEISSFLWPRHMMIWLAVCYSLRDFPRCRLIDWAMEFHMSDLYDLFLRQQLC